MRTALHQPLNHLQLMCLMRQLAAVGKLLDLSGHCRIDCDFILDGSFWILCRLLTFSAKIKLWNNLVLLQKHVCETSYCKTSCTSVVHIPILLESPILGSMNARHTLNYFL